MTANHDARTLGDRLLSLYITCAMPSWHWDTWKPHCRTCASEVHDRRNGDRWPMLNRFQLQQCRALEISCEYGTVVLAVPFHLIRWNALGGCLFHEIVPMWDEKLYGAEAFNVQDLSEFTSLKPLSSTSRSVRP